MSRRPKNECSSILKLILLDDGNYDKQKVFSHNFSFLLLWLYGSYLAWHFLSIVIVLRTFTSYPADDKSSRFYDASFLS